MGTVSPLPEPVALIGADGMLARMIRQKAPADLNLTCFDLPDFDLTDPVRAQSTLRQLQPRVIINCAAFTAVDACEEHEELATRVNGEGAGTLAQLAREIGAILVHISTDYVFAGSQERPYREEDATGPISAYGRSKLKGERAILDSGLKQYYIIRTSWLYGPHGPNFVETIIRLATERQELKIVADQIGSPTFTGDLADAIFSLLETNADFGIYHFADEGQCSWYEFAQEIVKQAKASGHPLRVQNIQPINTEEYPLPAKRPSYSVFDKTKYKQSTGRSIPDWQTSLKEYFALRNTLDH